jgi:hypothetical protein
VRAFGEASNGRGLEEVPVLASSYMFLLRDDGLVALSFSTPSVLSLVLYLQGGTTSTLHSPQSTTSPMRSIPCGGLRTKSLLSPTTMQGARQSRHSQRAGEGSIAFLIGVCLFVWPPEKSSQTCSYLPSLSRHQSGMCRGVHYCVKSIVRALLVAHACR